MIGVAIEIPYGPVVEAMMERGFAVHSLNPNQLDRFRDRFSPAGAKDDSRDALTLAVALRTDRRFFRRLEPDTVEVVQLREWTCIANEVAGERTRLANRLHLVARELSFAHRQMDRLTAAVAAALEELETDPGTEPQNDVDILASLPGVGRTVLPTLLSEALEPLRRGDYHALRCL